MKKYLVCANFSCTTGTDLEYEFTLMANDIAGAALDAYRILADAKSQLGFIIKTTVKYLRETTE